MLFSNRYVSVGLWLLAALLLVRLPLRHASAKSFPRMSVYEDASGRLSLSEIEKRRGEFRPVPTSAPNYCFTRSAFWFRLQATSDRPIAATRYLAIPHAKLDRLQLYVLRSDGKVEEIVSGDRIPAALRPHASVGLALPFLLHPGESVELFLRVSSEADGMLIPIEFHDEREQDHAERSEQLLHGIVLGFFGALFLYNLFLALAMRRRTYIYYVLYLPVAYLSLTSLNGFASYAITPYSAWIGNEGLPFFSGLAYLLILLFTREFLQTANLKSVDRWVRFLMAWSLLSTVSSLCFPVGPAYKIAFSLTFFFPLGSLIVGIAAFRAGRREARFYIIGQAASWVGLLAFALMTVGVLPYSPLLFESCSFGIMGDALLLSLALAERIRLLQAEKVAAEEQARQSLVERQTELERLVALRTSELDVARQQAETLARIDPLTGTYNRRGLDELAMPLLAEAHDTEKALCVVLFDIDHFKRVNDRFGHAEGDKVLQQVASLARQVCRESDLLGRIGGEEFLLALPNTSLENGAMLAERIRERFAAEIRVGFPSHSVTASFGLAATSEGHQTLDALVQAADARLYRAKQLGRNRVVLNLQAA